MFIRDAIIDDAPRIATIQIAASQAAYAHIVPPDYFADFTIATPTIVWRKLISAMTALGPMLECADGSLVSASPAMR